MKNYVNGFGLIVLASMMISCGGGEKQVDDIKDPMGRDGWVTKGGRIYKKGESVVVEGVGIMKGTNNPAMGRRNAQERAKEEIAGRIETMIASLRKDFMKSVSDMTSEPLDEQLVEVTGKSFTQQVISFYQTIDTHIDAKANTYYEYGKMDLGMQELANKFKSAVKPVVAQRIKQNSDEAFKRLDDTINNYFEKGIATEK
ncbi:MAG: hypothetical protein HY606_02555 [Planctomycetes bacterium]|nr:hypothetical protein [Planctomycetota bacterium]